MKLNPLYWLKINKKDGDGDPGGGGDPGGDPSMLPAGDPPADPGGDPPADPGEQDWFQKDKYKTVEDQAKAYPELQKKLGEVSGMIGAPEGDYEMTMPEGIEGEFVDGDPLMSNFVEVAKEMNLSQESFDKILHAYLNGEAGLMQTSIDSEMKALGENADRRLQDLSDFGLANLDQETYDGFRALASTATGVKVLESMMALTKDHKIPDGNNLHHNNSGETPQSLKEMRAKKDDHGNLLMSMDPAYRKKVDKAYNDYYGSAPKTTTVGG